MDLFWLSDEQWRVVAPLLPSRQTGPRRSDDRRIISGILHVLISGCAWRDCPAAYGPFMTVFNRFNRWKNRGIWNRIVNALAKAPGSNLAPEQVERLRAAIDARIRASAQPRTQFTAQRLAANRAWEEAAAQLRKIVQTHQGKPVGTWINAVVEWHMDSLFEEIERNGSFRAVPDDVVTALRTEIADLRAKLIAALTSLRLYLEDSSRNGGLTRQQLGKLQEELLLATIGASHARPS